MIHQKAHDLVGTSEEEAKNLPGSLLGLLLTLPKKVLLFLLTIVIAIAIIITAIGIFYHASVTYSRLESSPGRPIDHIPLHHKTRWLTQGQGNLTTEPKGNLSLSRYSANETHKYQ